MKAKILLVEDESSIAEPLAELLEREGFAAEVASNLEQARLALAKEAPDLVLLDVMLPDGDGRDLARDIRKDSDVPIVMLTARGEEIDRVLGLELGADDYVVKPFSARELTASRTLTKAGEPVELAAKEFDLLELLMSHPGQVMRREQIMDEVWDPHWFGPTKTLDVHISWLRKKIEDDPSDPRYITTIRGVGFRFLAPDEA